MQLIQNQPPDTLISSLIIALQKERIDKQKIILLELTPLVDPECLESSVQLLSARKAPSQRHLCLKEKIKNMSNNKKLYVGSLPYTTSEDELKTIFSEYGDVETVRIITDKFTGKSKGFGFV